MTESWSERAPEERSTGEAQPWDDRVHRPALAQDESVPAPDGLVTLRYLWDAVRRHTRVWALLVVAGAVLGFLVPVLVPPPDVATTALLLVHRTGDDAAEAMATDARLATTRTVANRVIERLNLHETSDDLLEQYTATALTNRVLEISVGASSPAEAKSLASTIAATFLAFRMEQVRTQLQPARDELDSQQARVDRLQEKQVLNGKEKAGTGDGDPLQGAKSRVDQLQQSLDEQEAAVAAVSSSHVLDPATVLPHSALRTYGIGVVSGLAIGLTLGVGFVVARALLSDKLWRRDAVAEALGAGIALSLGRVTASRWRRVPTVPLLSRFSPLAASSKRTEADLARAVAQIEAEIPRMDTAKPTLAIVGVDNRVACAVVTAAAARSLAESGRAVLVVDLSRRAAFAGHFAVDERGTSAVTESITVYVPDDGALPTVGPLGDDDGAGEREALQRAWRDADVVFTFAELSPVLGGDHLRTWATHAVVMVTAGHSTATRLRSVGDLVRLAGVRLSSAILLSADSTDETVGLSPG